MALVAGIDSSTQSCKVVVRDADTGALVRSGRASHPDGTEVAPWYWWDALQSAIVSAGGLDDVDAVSVGGQQHGMVALDARGEVVRDALLWNDTRSAPAALDLIDELRRTAGVGRRGRLGARRVPDRDQAALAARRRAGERRARRRRRPPPRLADLAPRRRTGPRRAGHRPLGRLRHRLLVARHRGLPARPARAGPGARRARPPRARPVRGGPPDHRRRRSSGPAPATTPPRPSRSACSPATSPSPSAPPGSSRRSRRAATADGSGLVTGFADATGGFLPLACTLNASRVLDAAARMLGVDHAGPVRAGPLRARGRRRARPRALPGGRAHARTSPTPPAPCTACAWATRRPRTWRAPRSRGCCARSPTGSTRCAPRASRSSGCSSSAAARSPPPCGRSRRRCSGSTSASRRPASTWPTAPPARPRGCSPGRATAPSWSSASEATVFTGDPVARVREQYAAVRELTGVRPA